MKHMKIRVVGAGYMGNPRLRAPQDLPSPAPSDSFERKEASLC